jgi:Fe-S oxidoreductase
MALQDYRPMMERCSNCLGCKWIPFDKIQSARFGENCPINLYYQFHTHSVRGKFQAAQGLLDGDYGYTDALLEATQACTSCGACDTACKVCRYNLEPLDFNVEMKNDAILKGNVLPVQQEMMDSLKKEQTMIIGAKKSARSSWSRGLKLKDAMKEQCEVVFFPGCKYSYDKKLSPYAKKAAELLIECGVDLGYMGSADMCCAGRAYEQGFFEEFDARADANIKAFKKAGVKTIVTPCSDCYYSFKRLYAKKGLDIEVLHIVEYIDKLITEKKLKLRHAVNLTVTYHDPCHLGRLGEPYVPWDGQEKKIMNQVHTWEPSRPRYNGAYGIYDAPRRILAAIPGLTLVEMERIREYSLCCGAGACVDQTFPEVAEFTSNERVTEANSTGADALVTACPWCESIFTNAVDENGKSIEVIDIIDLVSRAL